MADLDAPSAQLAKSFRDHLPDLTQERFTRAANQTLREYTADFEQNRVPPWLHELVTYWRKLYEEPFTGISSDGRITHDLFNRQDEGIDIQGIVSAAQHALSIATSGEQQALSFTLNAPERRMWTNPEFYLHQNGLRLEEVSGALRDALFSTMRASLSTEGYDKAIDAMRINGFLGEQVGLPHIMNPYSYNFLLFGTPSTTEPWAWCLYGHHLCLSVFIYGSQIVISPCFTGAEPNLIDEGPFIGTRILGMEESLGLKLMQSLTPKLQQSAQIYEGMQPPDLPADRWNKDDQRHLCGAARDNRIVPYEGVLVSGMNSSQQQNVLDILEQFLLYLPKTSRNLKLAACKRHFDQTYFCWIGMFLDQDPFYYRIQSPVILVEFDHHAGVFLTNQEPAKYHTHTILRTPNAGDYGFTLSDAAKGL